MLVPDATMLDGVRVKLVDFGIAKLAPSVTGADGQSLHTNAGALLGSPLYMSPEHCQGAARIDAASDVYSLGAMLYHLLAGQPPFAGDSVADILGQHLFGNPPPLAERAPGTSPALVALVQAMLAKAPADRPSSAAVAAALSGLLRPRGATSGSPLLRRLAIVTAFSLIALAVVAVVLRTDLKSESRAPLCSASGICPQQLPAGVTRLRDVLPLSAQDIWACGDGGMILHFDGTHWNIVPSGVPHRLSRLFSLSAKDVWVVGDQGTLLRFDGTRFVQSPGIPSAYLTGIWGPSADDLWVVGKLYEGQATILHSQGKDFTQVPSGVPYTLLAIRGSRADRIFAVGHQGTVLHYDGSRWAAAAGVPSSEKLTDLTIDHEQTVWVVGHRGTLLRYRGDVWQEVPTGLLNNLNGVAARSATEIFVSGEQGVLLRYDGHRVQRLDTGVPNDLDHLAAPANGRGFVAGTAAVLLSW